MAKQRARGLASEAAAPKVWSANDENADGAWPRRKHTPAVDKPKRIAAPRLHLGLARAPGFHARSWTDRVWRAQLKLGPCAG